MTTQHNQIDSEIENSFFLKQCIEQIKNETPEQRESREKRLAEYEKQKKIDEQRKLNQSIAELFGERFVNCTFDNYICTSKEQKNIVTACKDYIAMPKNNGESLLLYGASGTGKNHLLTAMFRDQLDCVLIARLEYLNAEKIRMQRYGYNWMDKFYNYCNIPFMLIPDLVIRKEGLSESVKELLLFIIDERYNKCKPVVICTNVDVPNLKHAIDFEGTERVTDRLREMIGNRVYCLNWDSYRSK